MTAVRVKRQRRTRPCMELVLLIALSGVVRSGAALSSRADIPLVSYRGSPHYAQPLYTLCVGAIFKNEGDNIAEWLRHYAAEGTGQFFLVNNNSTDGWDNATKPYIEAGWVTSWTDNRGHAQPRLTNHYFLPVAHLCEWFAVFDLDEFAYARHHATVSEYLRHLPLTVGSVAIPWKMFGSSGREIQPHDGIVAGFTKRKSSSSPAVKSISRPQAVPDFSNYHTPALRPGYARVFPTAEPRVEAGLFGGREFTSDELMTHGLALNHYGIQSKEWYQRVKIPRGDNEHANQDHDRTMQLYAQLDFAELTDEELSRKKDNMQ